MFHLLFSASNKYNWWLSSTNGRFTFRRKKLFYWVGVGRESKDAADNAAIHKLPSYRIACMLLRITVLTDPMFRDLEVPILILDELSPDPEAAQPLTTTDLTFRDPHQHAQGDAVLCPADLPVPQHQLGDHLPLAVSQLCKLDIAGCRLCCSCTPLAIFKGWLMRIMLLLGRAWPATATTGIC